MYFADTIDGQRVAATVQGNELQLNSPCARISFRGQWGISAGPVAAFYGLNQGDAAQPTQVSAALAGAGLLLTVRNAQGEVLLGPVLVTPSSTPATPAGC